MSQATVTPQETASTEEHDHPSDWFYIKIAIILAIFTIIEVATYFIEMPDVVLIVVLTILMLIKFVMVGAYFMHLKYDTPWFRWLFILGLAFAIVLYFAMLFAFNVF